MALAAHLRLVRNHLARLAGLYRIGTRHGRFGRLGSPQHQVSAARWIASQKLPNRRRIVFSDGRMAASVQLCCLN
jgi:hypothetical protein